MLRITCPSCRSGLRADAGDRVLCPKCGHKFDVPTPAPVAGPLPVPTPSPVPAPVLSSGPIDAFAGLVETEPVTVPRSRRGSSWGVSGHGLAVTAMVLFLLLGSAAFVVVMIKGGSWGGPGRGNDGENERPGLSERERAGLEEELEDLRVDILSIAKPTGFVPSSDETVFKMRLLRGKFDRMETVLKRLGRLGPREREFLRTAREDARKMERMAVGIRGD
jgi:hypothetical protein